MPRRPLEGDDVPEQALIYPTSGVADAKGQSGVQTADSPPDSSQESSLSGWFHVIWNGGPQYVLIDDQGRWTQLLLEEALTKRLGGPLTFNRKRVRIVGRRVSEPLGAIRVLSIEFE